MGGACSCANEAVVPSPLQGDPPPCPGPSAKKYPAGEGEDGSGQPSPVKPENQEWVKANPANGGFDSPVLIKGAPRSERSGVSGPPVPWEHDGGDATLPNNGGDQGWDVSPKLKGRDGGVISPEDPGPDGNPQDEIGDEDAELAEMLALLEQHRPLLKLLKGEEGDDDDDDDDDGSIDDGSPSKDSRDRASIIEELNVTIRNSNLTLTLTLIASSRNSNHYQDYLIHK